MNTRISGALLALAAATTSGVAVFVNGYGVKRFPDATAYTTVKNVVAALVLLAASSALGHQRRGGARRKWAALAPGQRLGLAGVAVIGGSVPFVLFFEGLSRADSTHAAFIHKTLVVWVVLLAVPLLRERLSMAHVAALALLVGGQAALEGGLGGWVAGGGEVMILAATMLWAVEVVVAKRLLAAVPSAMLAEVRMVGGGALLVAWVVVSGKLGVLADVDAAGWAWAALTGVILAGYVALWFAALARAQAVDVTAVLVFGAVVTATLGAVVKGIPLRPSTQGLVLILLGTVVVLLARPVAGSVAPPVEAVRS